MSAAPTDSVESFIARWQGVTASELASAQSFVIDLCRLLGHPAPHPTAEQDYMFERPVSFRHGDGGGSPGRIDCYRRGCFVLEKLKVGAGMTAKEKTIHDKGLVAVLKSLHDELDDPVLAACRWTDQPSDETIPEQLATLAVALGGARRLDDGRWLG